jgi:hypothetical protein
LQDADSVRQVIRNGDWNISNVESMMAPTPGGAHDEEKKCAFSQFWVYRRHEEDDAKGSDAGSR